MQRIIEINDITKADIGDMISLQDMTEDHINNILLLGTDIITSAKLPSEEVVLESFTIMTLVIRSLYCKVLELTATK